MCGDIPFFSIVKNTPNLLGQVPWPSNAINVTGQHDKTTVAEHADFFSPQKKYSWSLINSLLISKILQKLRSYIYSPDFFFQITSDIFGFILQLWQSTTASLFELYQAKVYLLDLPLLIWCSTQEVNFLLVASSP